MERRIYFLLGDVLANTAIGALAGLGAAGIVGAAWNMVLGMVTGMIVGMGVSVLGLLAFCPLFGALEVAVPMMLTGMLAGMGIAMRATLQTMDVGSGAQIGALIGLCVLLGTWLLNARLQGEERRWTS